VEAEIFEKANEIATELDIAVKHVDLLRKLRRDHIALMREAGITWTIIGDAFGTSERSIVQIARRG
jgi:hypothetical protein